MAADQAEPKLEITGSRRFNSWLAEQHISLAFTTYQTGKLFLIGLQPDGRLNFRADIQSLHGAVGDAADALDEFDVRGLVNSPAACGNYKGGRSPRARDNTLCFSASLEV